jgi:hypothetical protein
MTSAGEEVARWALGAKVVKAFSLKSRLRSRALGMVPWAGLVLAALSWVLAATTRPANGADVSPRLRVEVVVTGIPRPLREYGRA